MHAPNARQILVVAGNYEVVQSVQRALPAARFVITNAFNHRDAIYMLSQDNYDAFIADAVMTDRHSGDSTLKMLTEARPGLPLIAFSTNKDNLSQIQYQADAVVNSLDRSEILHAVTKAMRISILDTMEIKLNTNLDDALSRRQDEISTLFSLSKSLTEVLDLSEVLNRVVEAARDLTNAEEGMILLPEGEELYLRAKVGIDVDQPRNFRIKTSDTLAGEVFRLGKPTLVGASGPQKVKTEYFVNSLLYVPIISHGLVIGVLGVNNREREDLFDITHQQLLINLASFAAVAIENARIHEESLIRARELETLVAASQVVNSSLSIAETLPNICEQLAKVLNVGYSEIYSLQPDARYLSTTARFYQASWRFGKGPTINLAQHTGLSIALVNGQHKWLTYRDKEYSFETTYLRQVGAEAMLILPLNMNNQVLGALRFFYVKMPTQTLATEIIQQVRQLALETLVDLLSRTDRIMSDKLLRLANRINELVKSDWVELALRAKGTDALRVLTRIGHGIWLNSPYPHIDLTQFQDIRESLDERSNITAVVTQRDLRQGNRELIERTQGLSVLGLPLIQRGKTQGLVLFVDTQNERVFSPREIDMARAIVGQAATALENANLVHDLESSLKELRETQNRLIQTARLSAMGELAAVVAHQINNPLTTIIVDTELMLLDESKESRNYASLTAINRAGKRAANVARRLLAIARPTDPDTPPDLIDVVDTVRGVLTLVQTHVERNNIRINIDIPESGIPPVMAVKGRLDDVWLNLIMNAHDAFIGMSEEREDKTIDIKVHYLSEVRNVEITVADNGMGIPEDIKTQIFSPFFTTKPVGEGTGLGLHVCREVVENSGGKIWVESVPKKFTRFYVHLPAARARS